MATRINTEIDTATADRRLILPETRRILDATGAQVSVPEARALGDLFEKLTSVSPAPEGQVYASATSFRALESKFVEAKLPYGGNARTMTLDLARMMQFVELPAPLARAPRTGSMLSLTLHDNRPFDGTRSTMFFTPNSSRAYYRIDGGGRARPPVRWYQLDMRALSDGLRVQHLQAGQITPEHMNAARDSLRRQLATDDVQFAAAQMPPGKFVELGTLIADARGAFTVYFPVADHGQNLDNIDRYVIKRDIGGTVAYSAEMQMQPFVDPRSDGRVSDSMHTRARNIYFDIERRETWNWQDQPPPRDKHLVFHDLRGAAPTGAFVVERNADGAWQDPDYSREVWFRHAPSGKWSGPHAIDPLYV